MTPLINHPHLSYVLFSFHPPAPPPLPVSCGGTLKLNLWLRSNSLGPRWGKWSRICISLVIKMAAIPPSSFLLPSLPPSSATDGTSAGCLSRF